MFIFIFKTLLNIGYIGVERVFKIYGTLVQRADVILREIEKYLPKMYKSLMNIYQHLGKEDEEQVTREEYNLIDKIATILLHIV